MEFKMNPLKRKVELNKLCDIISREIKLIQDANEQNKLDDPNMILFAKILRGSANDVVNIIKGN
jgi:hypothetical protein